MLTATDATYSMMRFEKDDTWKPSSSLYTGTYPETYPIAKLIECKFSK
jgi:hypothetical protein